IALDSSWLDFRKILGADAKGIGCAVSNIYSEAGGRFRANVTQLGAFRIVLNGKLLPAGYGRFSIDLLKGWNRLLLKVAPQESGWACTFTLHACAPADYTDSNIAWRVPLPGVHGGFYGGGTGCSAPVIVGNRIYLLSEPHDLICLQKDDGRILWIRTNSYFDAATPQERKNPEAAGLARNLDDLNAQLLVRPLDSRQLEEKGKLEAALSARMKDLDPVRYRRWEAPDVGFSGLTPVSDGRRLYLWLASGVTACYDLDGKRQWIRVDNIPAVEHGFSSSPILVDGKLIVFMRDILAFDAATGDLAWRIPLISHEGFNPGGYFHGTPARADVGGVPMIVLGNGTIVRASDGKVLLTHPEMGNQAISSPVVDRGQLFETTTGSMKFFIHELPSSAAEPFKLATRVVSVATPAFPHYYMPWHMSSPIVHDGLAYLLNNAGVLTVVDVAQGKVLYQKMLDLDGFQTSNEGPARGIGISPALGGKYLYVMGNSGATLVLEPGREYKQIAKNKIENLVSVGHWAERQERFVSNPVFDGDRIYLRGEGNLYAIGPPRGQARGADEAAPSPAVPKRPSKEPTAPVAEPRLPEEAPSPVYGFRRNGTGLFPGATPPLAWSETKNVRWKAEVGKAHASPIVAKDRIIVLSEPGELICLNRADGSKLWNATLLERSPGSKEMARATPVTDGRAIFVSLAQGTVCATGLDGIRLWTQHVVPPGLGYGPSSSPVLVGGTLLVDGKNLQALEAASGRILWSATVEPHYGTPAIVTLDGVAFAVTAKGAVVRVSDGAVLATQLSEGLGGDQAPSPVVRGDMVYFAYKRASAVQLAWREGKIVPRVVWEQELPGDMIASPVIAGGMLFTVPAGSADYRVLHAATGEILLEKELDLSSNVYPSLALAEGRLYVGNDQGDMLVLDPGRVYKELQHNRLSEGSAASPAFAGPDLFLRAGAFLYCVSR
ncbi:MAG TPA: PQQ-binding-like beta-propeller repeat protein, partial [Planctomycetota bacterium]|nr:PQQ-binding-like beta-propeller repeat protein [Planctomycetota bacterium]